MEQLTKRLFTRREHLVVLLPGILCFWGLTGCRPNGHLPKIVHSPTEMDLMLSIPDPIEVPNRSPENAHSRQRHGNVPASWYPLRRLEKPWAGIVIHHSGTPNGNMEIFDRWHREGNQWDGVGYDFVIGNGTDSGNGQVEVTFRWREQKTGAHCKTHNNWANENTIGICLVGDFEQTRPSDHQMQSLARLVGFLQERYRIPLGHLYGHNCVPNARFTECPGSYFSFSDLHTLLVR